MKPRNEVRRVVVVGASGFGRESLDVLDAMISGGEPLDVVGVVDDTPSEENLLRLRQRGVPYIGTIDEGLSSLDSNCVYVLGIGNPSIKPDLVSRIEAHGIFPMKAVHPTAIIGVNTEVSPGVVICAGAVISTNVQIGDYVHINPNSTIGHDAVIDSFVSVNPGAVVSGEVKIESCTLIGASATVLQGLTVHKHAVVGACACVTKDVPAYTTVKGIPARI